MQKRHHERTLYFSELSRTSEKFFIPYIARQISIKPKMEILEVGCGEGGNLFPFAQIGCRVCGIDISKNRISQAKSIYRQRNIPAEFVCSDMFKYDFHGRKFDVIICHDVIEHIENKQALIALLYQLLTINGVIFCAFPLWQMPFGGHQQICRSRMLSHLPFIHLLPASVYRRMLMLFGEGNECVAELLAIKETGLSVEDFRTLIKSSNLKISMETFWLINPHYQQKFGITPINKIGGMNKLRLIRNFFTTSYWCILTHKN